MKRLLTLFLLFASGLAFGQPGPTPISPLTGNEQFVLQSNGTQPCTVPCFTTSQIIKNFVGSGGGASFTAPAATALSAGTAVALNSSGQVQQTWGPAPNINGVVTLGKLQQYYGNVAPVFQLSTYTFVVFMPFTGAFVLSVNPTTAALTAGSLNSTVSLGRVLLLSGAFSNVGGIIGFLPAAASLSASSFAFAYLDPATGNIFVAAATISGTTINAVGTGVQIDAQAATAAMIAGLGSTAFIVTYAGADGAGYAVAATVSGTTITSGTKAEFDGNIYGASFVYKTSSTGALLIYTDGNTSQIVARVAGVSGNAVTLNAVSTSADLTFGGSPTDFYTAAQVSSTAYAVAGQYQFNFGGMDLLTVSGTTVTWANEPVTVPFLCSITPLDASHVIVAGGAVNANGPQQLGLPFAPAVFGIASGAFQQAALVQAPYTTVGGVAVQSSTSFLFTQQAPLILELGDGATGSVDFIIAEGDNLGNVSPGIHHPGFTNYWLFPIDATHALAVLQDASWTLYARVINIEPIAIGGPVGFVAQSYAQSATATVQMGGAVSGFSGLTAGDLYYINGDGTLTTANTGHRAGVAISSSAIVVGPTNYLLKRDVDPASNDNAPLYLNEAA